MGNMIKGQMELFESEFKKEVRFQTSYFARINSKKLPQEYRDRGISIARSARWWNGKRYPPLFPPYDIINIEGYNEYYEKYYREVLSNLSPRMVWNDLVELNGGNVDVIILCHESWKDIESGKKFCHRRIVAKWLESELWETIPEFDPEKVGRI